MGFPRGAVTGLRLSLDGATPGGVASVRAICLLRAHAALVPRTAPRILAGRVVGADPLRPEEWRVLAETPGGERAAAVHADGSFVLRDLPPFAAIPCRLDLGARSVISGRGPVAYTASDEWDWNFLR